MTDTTTTPVADALNGLISAFYTMPYAAHASTYVPQPFVKGYEPDTAQAVSTLEAITRAATNLADALREHAAADERREDELAKHRSVVAGFAALADLVADRAR